MRPKDTGDHHPNPHPTGSDDSTNVLVGAVSGVSVQASAIHGDVHVVQQRTGSDRIIPRQLLPLPRRFASRKTELAELTAILRQSFPDTPTAMVLRGAAGVGKTALALRWLADVVHLFPDGQLYAELTLSTGEPVAPEDVLAQFLRALGVPPDRVPPTLAERAALYRSVTAEQAIVVLLDDAVSAAQVRVLRPTSPRSLLVITSRHQLIGLVAEGVRVLPVVALDRSGGLAILADAVGGPRVAAERTVAERLVDLCGGLPVALCVVAARAAARPNRPLAHMATELAEERTRLDALSIEDELSVRSTFDVAYAGLPERLRRCYRILGTYPGNLFVVDAVAIALDIDSSSARRELDGLVDANLLDELARNDYRFHDLVRVHALDMALTCDSDEIRMRRLRRVLEWYLAAAQAANRIVMPARRVLDYSSDIRAGVPEQPLDWLDRHRPSLIAAVRDAAQLELTTLTYQLSDALQPLFLLHHRDRDAVMIDELGLRAAEASGDVPAEFSVRKRLARTYAVVGDFDRSARMSDAMLRRARTVGDRRNEASALKSLGQLALHQGRPADAERLLTQSLAVVEPLHRPRRESLLLIDLGEVLRQLDRPAEAADHLHRAIAVLSRLHPADPYNLARAEIELARVNLATGEWASARTLLDSAIATLSSYGADHERARAHRTMAVLAREIGDPDLAEHHDRLADGLVPADTSLVERDGPRRAG